jgi:hypothetical protein
MSTGSLVTYGPSLHCAGNSVSLCYVHPRRIMSSLVVTIRPCFTHAGGHIPRLQVYPSGAAYHTSCVAQRAMQLSADRDFCASVHALLRKLSAKGDKPARRQLDPRAIAQAQQQLAALLREGDPMNSESVLNLLGLPYGAVDAQDSKLWSLSAAAG